jgi:hypothetical protein
VPLKVNKTFITFFGFKYYLPEVNFTNIFGIHAEQLLCTLSMTLFTERAFEKIAPKCGAQVQQL